MSRIAISPSLCRVQGYRGPLETMPCMTRQSESSTAGAERTLLESPGCVWEEIWCHLFTFQPSGVDGEGSTCLTSTLAKRFHALKILLPRSLLCKESRRDFVNIERAGDTPTYLVSFQPQLRSSASSDCVLPPCEPTSRRSPPSQPQRYRHAKALTSNHGTPACHFHPRVPRTAFQPANQSQTLPCVTASSQALMAPEQQRRFYGPRTTVGVSEPESGAQRPCGHPSSSTPPPERLSDGLRPITISR
ncbi:hypothetical protein GE09DRAFT_580116 [Coniochaeta sp. 2T2.1]|nr:hypothetical protein GE09DRAFT_580116 [Coniochaeta sp. 2T2.1]